MKKIMNLLAAALLVLTSLFSAVGTVVKASVYEPEGATRVVVHKILMNQEDLANFQYKEDPKQYSGGKIEDLQKYFGNNSAKEIEGVFFDVYMKVNTADSNTKTGAELAAETGTAVGNGGFEADSRYLAEPFKSAMTEKDGANFVLPIGTYVFVENKAESPYYNQNGSELTGAKAVPFTLTLPQTKYDGTGNYSVTDPLHVYPKNTEDKPTVDKTFNDGTIETKPYAIGTEIPYKVTTNIPKDADYKTMAWDDVMVEGLDFKTGSLKIMLGDVALSKDEDYTLAESLRGFVLSMTETGLAKVKEAAKANIATITLTYSGVLNASAKVDTEIPNTVDFHYGNRPGIDSLPKLPPTVEPKSGELVITKTWGVGANKVSVMFDVYEELTGTKVATVTLQAGEQSVTVSGLEDGKKYVVREQKTQKTLPDYKPNGAGQLTVNNEENYNPEPIRPKEPKVITYGRRFVKVNDQNDILAGAEFVVKNSQEQFLAAKPNDQRVAEKAAYEAAEAAYQKAVKANQSKDQIETLQKARDLAYGIMNNQWDWIDDQKQAYTFTAGEAGRFEVKGLGAGKYFLQETKAPEGYALLTADVEFEVGPNTWNDATGIDGHTKVTNKKITIPQTGGIGTVLFTIGGLGLMVFAFVAMKKREADRA
ncbi:SpaH/EbpB family LPXTG-anchored major pilin [Streptococcus ovuberis]|uniref:SpaH/EbpB family LPXTG-anchored major pilin n=1 Tax=Streptococcus ovuberis TaxID=1936207 RepID=A0A7X6MYR7_9STRE|nr:SpaH/EbpB family LPXTG-anchored major pilin [Streptococcus ovuberis]NKZ19948.1 SpaH/EbpB family LPXTG-anchored major pilin [Streptococcus ovuberis]